MILSIASGKGGTGKTTLAVSIASYLDGQDKAVTILDCDVEEPNVNLFLKTDIKTHETVYVPVPAINDAKCSGCGKCEDICRFSSIIMIEEKPLVFPDMCHSCGGCKLVCPTGAISEATKEIGVVEEGCSGNIRYIGGALKISEAISSPLIQSVKKYIAKDEFNIIDSPPGTSCPVIESIKGSDYVILVTEPTPFGLYDLKLSAGMIREIGLPFGIILNRSDIGGTGVIDYCNSENIDILAEIPNSITLARKYSTGDFVDFFLQSFAKELQSIISLFRNRVTGSI